MNWLLIVTIGIIAIFALTGLTRGLIKSVMSVVVLVLTFLLVSILTPYVGTFLTDQTPVYKEIKNACVKSINVVVQEEGTKLTDQLTAINGLPIPQSIRDDLAANNNSEVYNILGVDGFIEYIGGYLAKSIVNIISYLLTFLIVFIVLKLISKTMNFIAELPILRSVNRLGGLLLGLAQGVLLVWLFMLILTLFINTPFGGTMAAMIDKSPFLTYMYDNNMLLNLIFKLTLGL